MFGYDDATPLLPVSLDAAVEPVLSALVSMSLLTAEQPTDPWVSQTAAQLDDDRRYLHQLWFDAFQPALLVNTDEPTFEAYLDQLASGDPVKLCDRISNEHLGAVTDERLKHTAWAWLAVRSPGIVRDSAVAHLRWLWTHFVKEEQARHEDQLRGLSSMLEQTALSNPAWSDLTAPAALRRLARSDLPDTTLTRLGDVEHIKVVLHPHADWLTGNFGQPGTLHVFMRFEGELMRRAPITRAETQPALAALADDTRLALLEMLTAAGELRAQDLIARLDASQPNVSRHLKQLVTAGLVSERRAGDANKLYRVNPAGLRRAWFRLSQLLAEPNAQTNQAAAKTQAERKAALAAFPAELRRFLDKQGRVEKWPVKPKDQPLIVGYLATKFEAGAEYTEREVNAVLNQWHTYGDPLSLRRELVDRHLLDRTPAGSRYWRNLPNS